MPKHNYNIDTLKVVACFLVIVNHVSSYLLLYPSSINYFFYCLQLVFCRLAVPIFIMCTGYLLSQKETKNYFSKIGRIMVPLFCLSFLIYILQNHKLDLNFFITFLRGPIIEPYWYLYMLIGLYLIIPFLNKIIKNSTSSEIRFLIIFCFLTAFLKNIIGSSNPLFFASFPSIFGYYFLGAFLRNNKVNSRKNQLRIFLLFIFGIGILSGTAYLKGPHELGTIVSIFHIDSLFVVVLSLLFMKYILSLKIKESSLKKNLGTYTLGIYLIHPLLQNKIYSFLELKGIFTFSPIFGIILLETLLFLLAIGIIYFLKKIPLLKNYI